MYKFTLAASVVISLLFLFTGGYKAMIAFWCINGIILAIALGAVGLDKLLKRKRATR